MQDLSRLTETGHAIQLAVAPVFLLSGVSAMLAVLTNRLARIIDRGRHLEAGLPRAAPETAPAMRDELSVLSQRARLINWAISPPPMSQCFVPSAPARRGLFRSPLTSPG